MQRFFLRDIEFKNSLIINDKELVHQIAVVLRSRVGDYFIFFDGKTFVDKVYRLQLITKNALEFKFVEDKIKNEEKGEITLYQALPNKLEKFEYIVQKGTEVGYTRFVFFKSDRSQKLILTESKKERLQKIIIEATEQSWRNIVPELYFLDKLDFGLLGKKETYFFHTLDLNAKKISELKYNGKNINLLIGPEGGWSEFEVIYFEKLGFIKVYLGDNILRCETVSGVTGFYIAQNKNLQK